MSERVTRMVQRDRNHPSVTSGRWGMSQATALITTHSIADQICRSFPPGTV